MSAASLESLSNELFEQVIQHLNLNDIRNVRLVSRSTASKAAQDTYRAFFKAKHIDLRREYLESFVQFTSRNGTGCLVEDLSLVGVVYNSNDLQRLIETGQHPRKGGSSRKVPVTVPAEKLEAAKKDLAMLRQRRKEDENLREEGDDVLLLNKAFSNIISSKRNTLKRLSLRIKIHRGDTVRSPRRSPLWRGSKRVLQAASSTFCLAMESFRHSQLKVQNLDIFFALPEQLECSLPCDNLGSFDLATGRLGACLSTLKTLSVSITDRMVDETKYYTQEFGEEEDNIVASEVKRRTPEAASSRDMIANEKNYSALSEMLKSCPELEELKFVGYRLDCSDEELKRLQCTMRQRYVHYLARATPLSRLRKLCLANLDVKGPDLLTLIKNHSTCLRELDLNELVISEGSFTSVVQYVTVEDRQLEAIRFENIHDPDGPVQFLCDWEREGVDSMDRDIVRRWGPERKDDISYFTTPLARIGIPTIWEWTLEQPVEEEDDEYLEIDNL